MKLEVGYKLSAIKQFVLFPLINYATDFICEQLVSASGRHTLGSIKYRDNEDQ